MCEIIKIKERKKEIIKYTGQVFADASEELDSASVAIHLSLDEEAILGGEGDVEEGQKAKGRNKNDSTRFCHIFIYIFACPLFSPLWVRKMED